MRNPYYRMLNLLNCLFQFTLLLCRISTPLKPWDGSEESSVHLRLSNCVTEIGSSAVEILSWWFAFEAVLSSIVVMREICEITCQHVWCCTFVELWDHCLVDCTWLLWRYYALLSTDILPHFSVWIQGVHHLLSCAMDLWNPTAQRGSKFPPTLKMHP